MYHLETHCIVFESRLCIIGSCYPHLSTIYMNRLLLFVGNFIHVYNVFRLCILAIILQFIPVRLHFPFCVKPAKSIGAICINMGEGSSVMLIITPWPSNTLGTSAQMPFSLSPEATQQFPSQRSQFQHGSFPFPLLSYHLVELLCYRAAHLWIHPPRCSDTGLCYPAWFASTLQFVSLPWIFCILSGDIQRRVLQN